MTGWRDIEIRTNYANEVYLQILEGEFAAQVSHEVDGLIFQPVPDVS